MNLKCLFGMHDWYAHTKCKCRRCGKIRDNFHVWEKDCETCQLCSTTRQNAHSWEGCKCPKCGKTRDEEHSWEGCKCTKCGKTQNEGHSWEGCKCSKCGKIRDDEHSWEGCKCTKCGKTRHQFEGCKCKVCAVESHDLDGCYCRRCGKTFHAWINNDLPNDACRRCGLSGSDRNKTVTCTKCGRKTTLFLSSSGKLILALSLEEARSQAYWCDKCRTILCGSCVGVPKDAAGLVAFRSLCPVCGGKPMQAAETCLTAKEIN
jgi:hypothetical protein